MLDVRCWMLVGSYQHPASNIQHLFLTSRSTHALFLIAFSASVHQIIRGTSISATIRPGCLRWNGGGGHGGGAGKGYGEVRGYRFPGQASGWFVERRIGLHRYGQQSSDRRAGARFLPSVVATLQPAGSLEV